MNKGSAYIPDGILPHRSHPDYMKIYWAERIKHDPGFLERYKKHKVDSTRRWRAKKRAK